MQKPQKNPQDLNTQCCKENKLKNKTGAETPKSQMWASKMAEWGYEACHPLFQPQVSHDKKEPTLQVVF